MRHHRPESQPADDAPGSHHVGDDIDRKARPVHRSGHRLIYCPSGLAPVVGAPILARSAFAPAAFGALIVGIVGDPPVTRPPVGRPTLVVVAGHGRSFPQTGARPRPLNPQTNRTDNPHTRPTTPPPPH